MTGRTAARGRPAGRLPSPPAGGHSEKSAERAIHGGTFRCPGLTRSSGAEPLGCVALFVFGRLLECNGERWKSEVKKELYVTSKPLENCQTLRPFIGSPW